MPDETIHQGDLRRLSQTIADLGFLSWEPPKVGKIPPSSAFLVETETEALDAQNPHLVLGTQVLRLSAQRGLRPLKLPEADLAELS